MPPALSVIGPKVSIASVYAQLISIPIVATAVPKMPATLKPRLDTPGIVTWLPRKYERPSAALIASTGRATHSKPTAIPVIIVVAGPVIDEAAISRTGRHVP